MSIGDLWMDFWIDSRVIEAASNSGQSYASAADLFAHSVGNILRRDAVHRFVELAERSGSNLPIERHVQQNIIILGLGNSLDECYLVLTDLLLKAFVFQIQWNGGFALFAIPQQAGARMIRAAGLEPTPDLTDASDERWCVSPAKWQVHMTSTPPWLW